jgi:hypothetical protein
VSASDGSAPRARSVGNGSRRRLRGEYGDSTFGLEYREMNALGIAVPMLSEYGFQIGHSESASTQVAPVHSTVADEHFQWRIDQPLQHRNET